MDLLMDVNGTNDLVYVNGECPVVSDLPGVVAQRLFIMLRTFMGEWFLNTQHGIPYFQNILGKKITKSGVDNILQDKILAETEVSRISEWTSDLAPQSRAYSVRFKVIATNGEETEEIVI